MQKVIIVDCKSGMAPTTVNLSVELDAGWKVISAIPILESSYECDGSATRTSSIIYIIEK